MPKVGGLGPLQMMGVSGGMSWLFTEIEKGTLITHQYHVAGFNPNGWQQLSKIVEQVQATQLNRLIA
jgi:hypothetical protein